MSTINKIPASRKDLIEEMRSSENKLRAESYGLFTIGIVTGILGGRVGGVLDRNFDKYGHVYDIIVVVLFAVSAHYLIKIFEKRLRGK